MYFLHYELLRSIVTTALCYLLIKGFNSEVTNATFDEITVKRANIVAEDGSIRMVLSNETRQHPGFVDGIAIPARQREAQV